MHKAVEEAYSPIDRMPSFPNSQPAYNNPPGTRNVVLAKYSPSNGDSMELALADKQFYPEFNTGFTVQVMSLPNSAAIESLYLDLKAKGYSVRIQEVFVKGKIHCRLLLGNTLDKADILPLLEVASKIVDSPKIRSIESLKGDGTLYAP